MGRTTDLHKLRAAARLIQQQPGKKPGEYARMLHMHRQAFRRLLPQMEEHDIYLYEDEEGRLWPYKMPE